MNCSSLSPMININAFSNYYAASIDVYDNYFMKSDLVQNRELQLNGKKIYFNRTIVNDMYEMFWHLISFNFKKEKYDISPCTNLLLQKKCMIEKKSCNGIINIPFTCNLKERADCFYRLSTIHWIDEIILLKDLGDSLVKYWEETRKNRNGAGVTTSAFLRFEEESVDYVIVFQITESGYLLKSAYPLTQNGTKVEFDKKYKSFKR